MSQSPENQDANRRQIEFWNGGPGRRWVTNQEALDRVWRPIGDPAIERAAVLPGERVIDVGCGCGATTLELAARIGPSGSAVGIDISQPMLARARERAQTLGLANLAFVQADASTHQFAGNADLVFSRAGVMFFGDPVAAFTNLRRALRPGGRIVFVCFRDRQLNPWWTVPLAAAANAIPSRAPTLKPPADLFALADEPYLRAMLDASGFVSSVYEAINHDLVLGDDVDSATEFSVEAGPVGLLMADADHEIRARIRQAIRQSLAGHAGPAGISLRAATWIVQAINVD